MSNIPGIDLEAADEQPPVHDGDPNVTPETQAQDDDDDQLIETVKVGEQKMVPVGELVAARKAARSVKQQLKDIGPQLQRAAAIEAQLNEVRPILDAIKANPKLVEAVTRGTHATSATVEQPEHDQEAKDTAEDMGFYTTDGQLDVARARRVLDRIETRNARRTQSDLAPLKQQTAVRAAQEMRGRVDSIRTKEGTSLASKESLDEIFGMVPPELQADGKTAFVLALAAAGMDIYTGRKPAAAAPARSTYDEPIYTEPSGGRRGAVSVSAELAALGKRVGLTEKDLGATVQRYVPGRSLELE